MGRAYTGWGFEKWVLIPGIFRTATAYTFLPHSLKLLSRSRSPTLAALSGSGFVVVVNMTTFLAISMSSSSGYFACGNSIYPAITTFHYPQEEYLGRWELLPEGL
jgi:hypothetical protein